MTMIYVINKSTKVADADVHLMTRACAHQIRYDVAPIWGLTPVPVMYTKTHNDASPGAWVIAVLDDADQANALGWHTEEQGDLIYGRVFVNPVLSNGGDVLTSDLSVSSVLSHEVVETFVDPHINRWADNGSDTLYALEACDPVEDRAYSIPITHDEKVVDVAVSDFVTPAWFDAQSGGARSFRGSVQQPFAMTSGGYVIKMAAGQVSQQFGDKYPDWRKDTKTVDTARSSRRH